MKTARAVLILVATLFLFVSLLQILAAQQPPSPGTSNSAGGGGVSTYVGQRYTNANITGSGSGGKGVEESLKVMNHAIAFFAAVIGGATLVLTGFGIYLFISARKTIERNLQSNVDTTTRNFSDLEAQLRDKIASDIQNIFKNERESISNEIEEKLSDQKLNSINLMHLVECVRADAAILRASDKAGKDANLSEMGNVYKEPGYRVIVEATVNLLKTNRTESYNALGQLRKEYKSHHYGGEPPESLLELLLFLDFQGHFEKLRLLHEADNVCQDVYGTPLRSGLGLRLQQPDSVRALE